MKLRKLEGTGLKSIKVWRNPWRCAGPLGGKRARDSQHVMEITQAGMPSWRNHITELKKLGQVQGECEKVCPSKIDSSRLLSEEFYKIVAGFNKPVKELNPSSRASGYVTGFVYVVECHLVAVHKLFQDGKYREEIKKSHF